MRAAAALQFWPTNIRPCRRELMTTSESIREAATFLEVWKC